ncbi:uncharacterized protein LOC143297845 isoform X2 [Babylonia areolata]|uniref:uncharacterized protein LOC143297845 isoform X2 n=1 Tax=Babylonia areolata TaxID=304850 RepID=UPI003FD50AB9
MDERLKQGHASKTEYNNDTQKCIQALEQESQKSSLSVPPDFGNHPQPPSHSNDLNHSSANSYNRNNSGSEQPKPVGAPHFSSVSQASVGMPRYQEVPVKHETTHISTVKHNVAPPTVPPKPLPPKPDSFAHSGVPTVQSRAPLMINPANRGDARPNPGPAPPPDFSSFLESSRKQTDIPNIRCGPLTSETANSGSPESRRPVRVINVQGHTGGTVMSGPAMSPTSACSNPRFRVLLGDGGGLCSMPASSAPVTSPNVNPYRFASQAFSQLQQRVQEPERGVVHSSSIYIDPTASSRITNIQESVGDPSVSAHPQQYRPNAQFMEVQGPSSNPVPRTMQPLTVSLSSHAVGHGTPDQGQNVVSYAGFAYTGGYNPGFSHTAPTGDGSGYPMNMANRFSQEGTSASPPLPYQLSLASQGMNQLSLASGSEMVGHPPVQPMSSPNLMGVGMFGMSPVLMHKTPPRLQHQPSTGSSTSRSNSMDSEHSGTPHPSDGVLDPPFQPHSTPPLPPQRGMGVMGVVMSGSSPMSTSSQSSISSESSLRDRDFNSQHRRRSGSIQEEAAYTQALLVHQRQRMDKLTEDIEEKRQQLDHLRREVSEAEKSKIVENSLRTTFPTAEDISRLCESNRRLQTDIQMYLNEIDMYKNGQTPFSIIDPMGQQNFFNNMPTGPNDLFTRPPIHRPRTPPPSPPPRPPPPRHPPHSVQRVNSNDLSTTVPAPGPSQMQGGGSADSEEGEKWACSACTFENHPALKKCEICEMPRLTQGS